MSKFNFPKRVNTTLADEGVGFRITDEFDQYWGTFTVRWMDRESTKGRNIWQRAGKKYGHAMRTKKMTNEELGRIILIENFLVDWDLNPEITGGKKLPYSIEAAKDFFSNEETTWLAAEIADRAADITNFGMLHDADGEPVAVPEKN